MFRYARPHAWAACALVAAWLAYAALVSSRYPLVLVSDAFGFMERARQLSLSDISVWVHGFYPFGYPLALRGAFSITGDYEQAGRLISVVSGGCSLLAVYAIGTLAFSRGVAMLGLLVCASNPTVVTYGTNSGTDMAAAACVVAAVMCGLRAERGDRVDEGDLVAAGLFLGLGYLVRYTTLLLVPAFLLWLWVRPRDRSDRESPWAAFRQMGGFLLAFVVVSSPQLILSTIVKGSPLWNLQGANVYFGMFGGWNWGTQWLEAEKHPSIAEVIASHPREFFVNFVRNVLRLPAQELVQFPFAFLAPVGLLFSLDRDHAASACEYSRRMLLVIVAAAFSFGICIAYCLPRYLLCVAMLMSVFAAYGFEQCVPRCAIIRRGWCVPVRLLLLVLFAGIVLHRCVVWRVFAPLDRHDAARIDTTELLRADGAADPQAVLAIGFDYYDVCAPTKDLYAMTWFLPGSLGKYKTVDGIVSQMRMHGQRYLVFDARSPALVGWPEREWPVPQEEWGRNFTVLSPRDADTTVLKLKAE